MEFFSIFGEKIDFKIMILGRADEKFEWRFKIQKQNS